jgi:hypothetical protein
VTENLDAKGRPDSQLLPDEALIHPLLRGNTDSTVLHLSTGPQKDMVIERLCAPGEIAPDRAAPAPRGLTPQDSELVVLGSLRAKQAELERERQRLLRLQEIEAEQAGLQTQIAEIGGENGRASSGI